MEPNRHPARSQLTGALDGILSKALRRVRDDLRRQPVTAVPRGENLRRQTCDFPLAGGSRRSRYQFVRAVKEELLQNAPTQLRAP